MQYKVIVTVHSDKEHRPISFQFQAPEELALMLMATPVKSVTIGVTRSGVPIIEKTPLLEFK